MHGIELRLLIGKGTPRFEPIISPTTNWCTTCSANHLRYAIYLGGTDDYVPLKTKSKKKENIKDGPRLTREEDEEDFDENGKFNV